MVIFGLVAAKFVIITYVLIFCYNEGERLEQQFNEQVVLDHLTHYLPSQSVLKDFVHHNTLHAFQDRDFFSAIHQAAVTFGWQTLLPLDNYRSQYNANKINPAILERVIAENFPQDNATWHERMLYKEYATNNQARIGLLRKYWKENYKFSLDKSVHSTLFRVLSSYLDQGIASWRFPLADEGFLASIRKLERHSWFGIFKSRRVKKLLLTDDLSITYLLKIVVGDERYFEQYLFDQQFTHPGWSGIVCAVEAKPETLIDKRKITLAEVIIFELLLEIDALDKRFGIHWAPLTHLLEYQPQEVFTTPEYSELFTVLSLWHQAYEWSLYDQVLCGINSQQKCDIRVGKHFQALFCMDDREGSLRRYIEQEDRECETFGTPGFFNSEFYYAAQNSKTLAKLCPAPQYPRHLIKESGTIQNRTAELHFHKYSNSLIIGWVISQTVGYLSVLRLLISIFRPSLSSFVNHSFRHINRESTLNIHYKGESSDKQYSVADLQIGYTPTEMADRVECLLCSIGLTKNFAPLIYIVSHGSTTVNNTHYAAYDCGACAGRPGSVNAKVFALMANDHEVRQILQERKITIPVETTFIAAIHDTTRDEINFFDRHSQLSINNKNLHRQNIKTFMRALDANAKERSRRFDLINSKAGLQSVHQQVKLRSVSLFETRPELNHATNAFCVVGRRSLTEHLFLDRRAFMNSYDYSSDIEGKHLIGIINAVVPVAGGINLEYYFSRVDNQKLGAGSKLPHNVMGLIGVTNGIDGDLRTGLPSQMIEMHDPVRLLLIIEHFPEVVAEVIKNKLAIYEWFKYNWINLVVVHPTTNQLYRFINEQFIIYTPSVQQVPVVENLNELIENSNDNLPICRLD